MDLNYDLNEQRLCDPNGVYTNLIPGLFYGGKPTWNIAMLNGSTAATLTAITSWRAAVDTDLSSSTTPMCRTQNANITVTGNVVSVKLDCLTATFLQRADGARMKTAYFELWGYDLSGDPVIYVSFPITVSAVIDPDGGEVPATPSSYYTQAQVDALFAAMDEKIKAANVYQFSVDGETNWHDTFASTDYYYRERKNVPGSAWGAAIPLGKSGVIIDNVDKDFITTDGQTDTLTFTKTELGIASDAEPQLSLWYIQAATLRDAMTAGAEATQIVLAMNDYPTADFPSSGTVTLTNAGGQSESFPYSVAELASGYMRLANGTDYYYPQHNYASGDATSFILKTQLNTASYIAKWSASSLSLTYYTTWIAGKWALKFS